MNVKEEIELDIQRAKNLAGFMDQFLKCFNPKPFPKIKVVDYGDDEEDSGTD